MPDYGSTDYWNQRYGREHMDPYDWLFDFRELEMIINHLIPDKKAPILLIGCGNAPFSGDLYSGGYTNLTNTDISTVVIEQQKAKHPEQKWLLMDVMEMSFDDQSIPVLLDKSLIDTVLCYSDSVNETKRMIKEVYRIMAPGSRYITFSLHSPNEVLRYIADPQFSEWAVSAFRIKSSRWTEEDARRHAAVAYTMVVADRCNRDGSFKANAQHPLPMTEALSEEAYQELRANAEWFNFTLAMKSVTVNQLMRELDLCLAGGNEPAEDEAEGEGEGEGEGEERTSAERA